GQYVGAGPDRRYRLQDLRGHRDEVADAAGDDEHVPDRVRIGQLLAVVEHGAQGVEQSAGEQPAEREAIQRVPHRLDRHQYQPAHRDVDQRGQALEAAGVEQFEDHSGEGQDPDRGEYAPAPRAAQADQRERGVGAGDQQVDRAVVKDLQPALGNGVLDGVVERGGGVQQQQGDAEDDGAGQLPAVAVDAGQGDQYGATGEGGRGGQPVSQGAGDFFADRSGRSHGQCGTREGGARSPLSWPRWRTAARPDAAPVRGRSEER